MAKKETIDLEVIKEMHPDCFDTPEDIANLGCDYWNGDGVEQNYEIDLALFENIIRFFTIRSFLFTYE